MAGRSGYGCLAAALLAGERLAVLRGSTDHAAVIAAYRGWLSKIHTETNRYFWRRMTARRAQELAWWWRDFAARYEGRTWEKRKVAPGQWIVRLLDDSGTWRDVFRVECPIPRRNGEKPPQVRLVAVP